MPGMFLITFDCEGKWGVVDKLMPAHQKSHTTPRLDAAYCGVLELLRKYRIGATFAFTAAFSMDRHEFGRLLPAIEEYGASAVPWMRRALLTIEEDGGDGWFAPSCFEAVREAGNHEIASHGFSHIPWGAPYASRNILEAELALSRQVAGFNSRSVDTFVYPRNQVIHQDLLPLYGYQNFRNARRSFGRAANLMREFNLFSTSEHFTASNDLPVALPAGYFLNSRQGMRRYIPLRMTVNRWAHILRHGAANDGVVHAWTHPENFVDGGWTFSLLENILRLVADARDAGHIRVVTCKELLAATKRAPAPSSAIVSPSPSAPS